VADGLSRQYVNRPLEDNDGHLWTVSEDWEARTGLAHDVFVVGGVDESAERVGDGVIEALLERFAEDEIFLGVVKALSNRDGDVALRERRRARHRAQGFFLEDGRLWKLGDPESIRARPKVECILRREAGERAWIIHRNGGHFHRDNIKAVMLDTVYCPGLDQIIAKAI
ncbi:hypothetical protein CPC08DRAFT_612428, partial [Agrocybe pediades]